jgi:hypothetical protein
MKVAETACWDLAIILKYIAYCFFYTYIYAIVGLLSILIKQKCCSFCNLGHCQKTTTTTATTTTTWCLLYTGDDARGREGDGAVDQRTDSHARRFIAPVPARLHRSNRNAISWEHVSQEIRVITDKKRKKLSSYIRKFRWVRLQSHI